MTPEARQPARAWALLHRHREALLTLAAGAAALAGYYASRRYFLELGLRTDDTTLAYFWQYLDPGELRSRPLRAVFYQHTQPPLYNLFLAAGLRSGDFTAFMADARMVFGYGLHGGLFFIMRSLRVGRPLAVITVWVAAFEPGSVLLENWLFYTYPVTATLTVSGALLGIGVGRRNRLALVLSFTAMAVVVLTRSLFHVGWMIGAVALVLWLAPRRKQTLALALVPLALAASLYVKNALVFGQPGASTWLGFSLARLTTAYAPTAAVRRMQEEGLLSEFADVPPWEYLARYPRELRQLPSDLPQDVAVLSDQTKPGGYVNFNHGAYVRISRGYLNDARVVLERHPEVYLEATERAWAVFFVPTHDYFFFEPARRRADPRLRTLERGYERFFGADALASWSFDLPRPPFWRQPGWRWAGLLAVSLLFALVVVRRERHPGVRATAAFLVWTIVVVAVIGNSLELGENNRFRFLAQPFSWALLALLLDRLSGWALRPVRRAVQRRRRRNTSPSPDRV